MSAPAPLPQADAAIIAQTLNLLFTPDDVIEVRALSLRNRNRTDAGYFDGDHRSDLIRDAVRLNGKASAVYVNLNPIDPQLLARYANRIQEGASSTATDANVTHRRWLLLDFDPVRPKDRSATDGQVEAAHAMARECYGYLRGEGWPEPVCAHSGNGFHLDYSVDLPNNEASRELIKAALKALATRFDSEAVKLDQSVFNAGRIVKLYGTVANKGDHTELAPWRLSHIIKAPERNAIVTVEQLAALVPVQSQDSTRTNGASTFDLPGFLSRLNIEYRQDIHEGRERYKLRYCPFNPEHGFGEAAIFRDSAGVLGFRCMHNTCTDKRWQDVRELVDGTRGSRTGRTPGAGEAEPWPDPQPLPALVVIGLHDFLARELPPREEILSPWLLSQSLSMIYSWRGVGKTHVALGIAYAIAAGGSFLGWKAEKARKVLYIDGEMPGSALQARLAAIVAASDVQPEPGMLNIITPDLQTGAMPDLAMREGQDVINGVIGDARVIIMDNLSCLARGGGRENEAESWLAVADWALAMRAQGRSVVFLHHSGKSGTQRGSSKREDLLDTVICLKRPCDYTPIDGAVFEVHYEKARSLLGTDTDPIEASLTTDEHGLQAWTMRKVSATNFDKVVALAKEGLTQPEISTELGINRSSVSRAVRKAIEEGKIVNIATRRGKNQHTKPWHDDD